MRQAVLLKPGSIEIKDIPMPGRLAPNEIMLKIHKIGVCGSDIHVFPW